MHAFIYHFNEREHYLRANARFTVAKRVCAQEHHRANDFFLQERTDGNAMAQDKVLLKLAALVHTYRYLGKLAKAGAYAVCDAVLIEYFLHKRP